jgi:hypothetical protein
MLLIELHSGSGVWRTSAAETFQGYHQCMKKAIVINADSDRFVAVCMPIIRER